MVASLAAPAAAAADLDGPGPVQGEVAFECEAVLPVWPTIAGSGGTCEGTASGEFTHGTTPIVFVNANFSASFEYEEACALNEPPLVGLAEGTATIRDANNVVTVSFTWARVGLTAAIVLTGVTVNGHAHSGAVPGVVGAGTAAFAPLPPIPTCATADDLTAVVAGEATLGAL